MCVSGLLVILAGGGIVLMKRQLILGKTVIQLGPIGVGGRTWNYHSQCLLYSFDSFTSLMARLIRLTNCLSVDFLLNIRESLPA